MTDKGSSEKHLLELTVQEILHAPQYVQLVSVERYYRRDGEILLAPYYRPQGKNAGLIVRANFYVNNEDESRFIFVLYRVFGGGNCEEDITKIFNEIQRQAHLLYYDRGKTNKASELQEQ